MTTWQQVVLALVSWFVAALVPVAKVEYEDRALPAERRRGVSIIPGWPLMPLLLSAPVLVFGAAHVVARAIAVLHVLLLVAAAVYVGYWKVRLRRAG